VFLVLIAKINVMACVDLHLFLISDNLAYVPSLKAFGKKCHTDAKVITSFDLTTSNATNVLESSIYNILESFLLFA